MPCLLVGIFNRLGFLGSYMGALQELSSVPMLLQAEAYHGREDLGQEG